MYDDLFFEGMVDNLQCACVSQLDISTSEIILRGVRVVGCRLDG